ncbi:MAG: rod shape-determining protein MreD [Sphingomonadales bacterium]
MAKGLQKGLMGSLANASPAIFTIFLILFIRVPFEDSDAGMFIPTFSLVFTYYFRLHFPQYARLWLIFLLGLLEDFLGGGYLGLTSLILLLVSALFERRRNIFLQGSFLTEIFIFTFFSLAISVVYWILASFIMAELLPGLPFFFQGLMTALVFPLYVFLIGRINKRVSI